MSRQGATLAHPKVGERANIALDRHLELIAGDEVDDESENFALFAVYGDPLVFANPEDAIEQGLAVVTDQVFLFERLEDPPPN